MLKLGFIGVGRMGKAHAERLKTMKEVSIHGIFDPSDAAATEFIGNYNVKKRYWSVKELATDKELDAVLVCNFSDQHYDTLVELLDAGHKRIFCEKALVRNIAEGEDLLKRVKRAEAVVMVGHHRRHQGDYAAMKNVIDSGRLGRPLMAKVAYCHPGYCRQWGDFFANFERCGGVILDMMSHLFDQLNWYFGEPDSVYGRSLMMDPANGLPVDYVSATLVYKNGVICNIDGSWQRYGVPYDKVEIYGDKAAAIVGAGGGLVNVYSPGEHAEIQPVQGVGQMSAFIKMVEAGEEPVNNLRAGFESVRVALGLIDSARSGQTFKFK
jgi:UDP-N-acetylglucosamine 3-dehydrogenase